MVVLVSLFQRAIMSMLASSFVVVPAWSNVIVLVHESVSVLARRSSLFYCNKCSCYSAL